MSRQPYTAGQYRHLVSRVTPSSRMLVGYVRAFWVGGAICALGQLISAWAETLNLGEVTNPMFTTSVLILIGTTLTGLGVYDRIGKYAGAGSAIPVTGFANSVAAPALEFKTEGLITGMAARMFGIAGPVLVFGLSSSVLYGLALVLFELV